MKIPAAYIDDGLCDVHMSRLSDIVRIACKNGSGKSRLLRRIYQCLNEKQNSTTIQQINEDISNWKTAIQQHPNASHINQLEKEIENAQISLIKESYLKLDEIAERYIAVYFVPNNLDLLPSGNISTTEQINRHDSCKNMGTNELNKNVLRIFKQNIPDI